MKYNTFVELNSVKITFNRKRNIMESIVVVGGGIVGLVSSILLKNKNNSVYLIEQDEKLGGLLKSITYKNEVSFDFGTHIPRQTGIKDLDDILFGHFSVSDWNSYNYLKVGNFFNGILYKDSQFIYSPHLEKEIFQQGFYDLLQTQPTNSSINNAEEFLEQFFGATFKQHIFSPLLKKLYDKELSELHPEAHKLFGYNRVICGNEFTSSALKSSDFFNEKLAYVSNKQGLSEYKSYYPKKSGIEVWIQALVEQAEKLGVKILKSTQIQTVQNIGDKVDRVILGNGEHIDCNLLVWTIPSIHLISKLGLKWNEKPLELRSVKLFNFEIDRPFLVDNHYIYCNDSNSNIFRITFYSNLVDSSGGKRAPYNCTVEVIGDYREMENLQNETILTELVKMAIISEDTNLIFEDNIVIKNGFPVMTKDYFEIQEKAESLVYDKVCNVVIIGRSSGKSFFMEDSLRYAYSTMKELGVI